MTATKAARATKKRPRSRKKPASARKARAIAKPARVNTTAEESQVINQESTTSRRERRRREALSESKEEQVLQQEFLAYQQTFLHDIQKSATLLQEAAQVALRSIREQASQAAPNPTQAGQPHAPDDPLNLTADFVNKAYQQTKDQAQKMFDEIGTKITPPSPLTPWPAPPQPAAPAAPAAPTPGATDPLAASAILMNQAMLYLSKATDSVMREVNRRLSSQVANPETPTAAESPHKPLA